MINSLIFVFLLLFSFETSASRNDLRKSFLDTEASFNMECSTCKKEEALEPFTKECLKVINSPECADIPKEERKTCIGEEDDLKLSDIGSLLYLCAKETVLSYKFILDFLLYAVESSTSWLLSSEQEVESSPSRNYVVTEFYKAYGSLEGTQLERFVKAAVAVGGQAFDGAWLELKNFYKKNGKTIFQCRKLYAQTATVCSFLVSLLIPVGAGVKGIYTLGKTGSKVVKGQLAATNSVTRGIQLKSLANDVRVNFSSIKSNILNSSKKLSRAEQREVRAFVQDVKPEQLVSELNNTIATRFANKRLTRENIRNAVLISLTVGAVSTTVKLSQKSAAMVADGLADTLVTTYVSEKIIGPVLVP